MQTDSTSEDNNNYNKLNTNRLPESVISKCVIFTTIIGILFFVVLYLFILLTNGQYKDFERDLNFTQMERLMAPRFTVTPPPRPFANDFRGPAPSSFLPNPSQRPLYPQLQENFNNPNYPRNFQEVLNYLMKPTRPSKVENKIRFPSNNDPFHTFKPKDPSDINLLATSNVRFAPPIWKDLNSNAMTTSAPMVLNTMETKLNAHKVRVETPKTIKLTLNVFPMNNDPKGEHFYGVSNQEVPYQFFGGLFGGNTKRRRNFGLNRASKKMVIHLNFVPEELSDNQNQNVDYPFEFEDKNAV